MNLRIGAAQLEDIQNDMPAAIAVIQAQMKKADDQNIAILCFPECFLQGYTLDESETKERALNLSSPEFKELLNKLAGYKVTIILGVIEEDNGNFFNAAVVIKNGRVLGKYRKVHLFEKNFEPGYDYPVFEVSGVKFGINICYDARFAEGAAELAKQGARVIFYPLNNKLPTEKAKAYRHKHLPNLIARAKETDCWVVSSDVVYESEDYLGYGCTTIVNPGGELIAKVMELEEGVVSTSL